MGVAGHSLEGTAAQTGDMSRLPRGADVERSKVSKPGARRPVRRGRRGSRVALGAFGASAMDDDGGSRAERGPRAL